MRDRLIEQLNRALDSDHDLIEYMLLKPKHLMISEGQSSMFTGKLTSLHMLCDLAGIERIYPVYEDDIIQRFE